MTVVDRGIMAVSSLYSGDALLVTVERVAEASSAYRIDTFIGVFRVYSKVKVATIAKVAETDDLALYLKHTQMGTIKGDSLWLLLRLELEEDGATHFCRCDENFKRPSIFYQPRLKANYTVLERIVTRY